MLNKHNKYKVGDLVRTRYAASFIELHTGMIVKTLVIGDLTIEEIEDNFSISPLNDEEPVYVILFGQKTMLVPEYKIFGYLSEESFI